MITDAQTSEDLVPHAWRLVEAALLSAGSERGLITHWLLTPVDDAVHTDDHWDDNDRIAKFLRVVIPTLADQLNASMLSVTLPWDVTDEDGTLILVTLVVGQPAAVDARKLTRSPLADAAPYWRLSAGSVAVPAQLAQIAAELTV